MIVHIHIHGLSIIYFDDLFFKGVLFEKDSEKNERVCTAPSVELK